MIRKKNLISLQNQYKNLKGIEKTRVAELLKLYDDGYVFSKIAIQKIIN